MTQQQRKMQFKQACEHASRNGYKVIKFDGRIFVKSEETGSYVPRMSAGEHTRLVS